MDTAMPLQLLQPLDGANPASTPVPLDGPEQRLIVTPDPAVGDESLLPPSQLLIVKDGESRSIWPVHLAGWQPLGWQLHTPPPEAAPEPEPEPPSEPEPEPQPAPELEPEPEPGAEPAPLAETSTADVSELPSPELVEPATVACATATSDGEALLASQPTDFQAMTKAQIVDYCSAVHGVELDSSQTKAELVEQATALEAQANDTAAADLAALELGDALL
jgi:outer membrane biosynthesis protein TonB